MIEPEGGDAIINTPPHLSRHPMRISQIEWLCLEEGRKRVRGCDWLPSRKEPHKSDGLKKPWQMCMG
jgi:hypothetical protein